MIVHAVDHRTKVFENHEVQGLQLKIGSSTVDLNVALELGQEVEIVLRGRVIEVRFPENQTNGQIMRQHMIKIDSTKVNG